MFRAAEFQTIPLGGEVRWDWGLDHSIQPPPYPPTPPPNGDGPLCHHGAPPPLWCGCGSMVWMMTSLYELADG